MQIVYIAAGAGSGHCGACARDAGLVRALMARGHQVLMTPLYTPLSIEGDDPSIDRVFYGGVGAWLEQHSRFFRNRRPGDVLDRFLDSPTLLRWLSKFAIETRAEKLGPMTQAVLEGEAGPQAREIRKLIGFLKQQTPAPDVIHLSNSLLSALAPVFRREFDCPVVCNFQGEDLWLNDLIEPYRGRVRELIRQHARDIALFTTAYAECTEETAAFFAVPAERVQVLPPCVDCSIFPVPEAVARPIDRDRTVFRVGFLSRIVSAKGPDLLADSAARAGAIFHQKCGDQFLLRIAGRLTSSSRPLYRRIREKVKNTAGVEIDYIGEPDLEAKLAFFRQCDVFSVPSRQPERRGMAVLEAMSCGIPVVLPDHGVYSALVNKTGGGRLVPPDDPDALAQALLELATDKAARDDAAGAAARGVREHFSTKSVACVYEELCAGLLSNARS